MSISLKDYTAVQLISEKWVEDNPPRPLGDDIGVFVCQ